MTRVEDKKLKIYYESDNRAYVQLNKYPNFIYFQRDACFCLRARLLLQLKINPISFINIYFLPLRSIYLLALKAYHIKDYMLSDSP